MSILLPPYLYYLRSNYCSLTLFLKQHFFRNQTHQCLTPALAKATRCQSNAIFLLFQLICWNFLLLQGGCGAHLRSIFAMLSTGSTLLPSVERLCSRFRKFSISKHFSFSIALYFFVTSRLMPENRKWSRSSALASLLRHSRKTHLRWD